MKEIKIENAISGKKFKGIFELDSKMNDWVAAQELKALKGLGWGWGVRDIPKTECSVAQEALILSEYDKVIEEEYQKPVYEKDQDNNIIYETVTEIIEGQPVTYDKPKQKLDQDNNPVFETVPAVTEPWVQLDKEYTVTIDDITTEYEAKEQRKEKKEAGKNARKCCESVKDLIAGYNLSRSLTATQIDQLETDFASIKSFLASNRPWSAKAEVQAMTPDEILVTTAMKNDIIAEFEEYGI